MDGSETKSPYSNGPYLVLDDGSTYSGPTGAIVYITDKGIEQLDETNDMSHVELDELEVIPVSALLDAYNKVHGTDL